MSDDLLATLASTLPVAKSVWTSTELVAALVGSLTGAAVTLLATALANGANRRLAREARDAAADVQELAAAWRVIHTFRLIASQLYSAHKGVALMMARPEADTSPWRALESMEIVGRETAFAADDLAIFVKLKDIDAVNALINLEHELDGLRAMFSSYSRLRDGLMHLYKSEIGHGYSDEMLAAVDFRFRELSDIAGEIVRGEFVANELMLENLPLLDKAFRPFFTRLGFSVSFDYRENQNALSVVAGQ